MGKVVNEVLASIAIIIAMLMARGFPPEQRNLIFIGLLAVLAIVNAIFAHSEK